MRAAYLLAVFAVLAALTPAFGADDLPLDGLPESLERSRGIGPLRLDPSFKLEEFGYDSNILLAPPGKERGDIVGRFAPSLSGQVFLGHRGLISFQEKPEYVSFARTSFLNYANNSLEGRADMILHRTSLVFGGRWLTNKDRPNNELDIRPRQHAAGFFTGAGWRTSSRTSVSFTLSQQQRRYRARESPDIGLFLDRHESRVSARLSYRIFTSTKLFVEYSRLQIEFDRSAGRNSRQADVMPGVAFDPESRLSGSIKAGPARFDAISGGKPDFQGILGHAEVGFRASELWKARTEWSREVVYSTFGDNLFFLDSRTSATASRALGERIALEAGWERIGVAWPAPFCTAGQVVTPSAAECERLRSLGDPIVEKRRGDQIQGYLLGTRLRLARHAEAILRVGYHRRTSNFPGEGNRQWTFTTGAGF